MGDLITGVCADNMYCGPSPYPTLGGTIQDYEFRPPIFNSTDFLPSALD